MPAISGCDCDQCVNERARDQERAQALIDESARDLRRASVSTVVEPEPIYTLGSRPISFARCVELIHSPLRARSRRGAPLGNNTRLERLSLSEFGIRLHNTIVVTIRRCGAYVLDSGGYRTATTKDRLNRWAPVLVSQRSHIWRVLPSRGYEFQDGTTNEREFSDGIIVRPIPQETPANQPNPSGWDTI